MISSREALIDALTEAAELEHGLLLQYIFGALTMKKRLDESLTGSQQESVRAWEGQILSVARQEMNHLGSVCNLLSSIGAAPQFRRPNFPQPANEYYPFNFQLTRFSDESLYRFIRAELPKGEPPPNPPRQDLMSQRELGQYKASFQFEPPQPLEYEYIGQLYGEIEDAFKRLDDGSLFIGPKFSQDISTWSRRFNLKLVKDFASAKTVIDNIVMEGEGSPRTRAGSHYAIFRRIRAEYHGLLSESSFLPARPVVANPQTRHHRDAPAGGTLIKNQRTLAVAGLFNELYDTMLLMLMQFFSYGGENPLERSALQLAIRESMSMFIRPVAELLTELPVDDSPDATAGPPFELYTDLRLAFQSEARWTMLFERLDGLSKEAARLARELLPRLSFVSENIALVSQNLKGARSQSGLQ